MSEKRRRGTSPRTKCKLELNLAHNFCLESSFGLWSSWGPVLIRVNDCVVQGNRNPSSALVSFINKSEKHVGTEPE